MGSVAGRSSARRRRRLAAGLLGCSFAGRVTAGEAVARAIALSCSVAVALAVVSRFAFASRLAEQWLGLVGDRC